MHLGLGSCSCSCCSLTQVRRPELPQRDKKVYFKKKKIHSGKLAGQRVCICTDGRASLSGSHMTWSCREWTAARASKAFFVSGAPAVLTGVLAWSCSTTTHAAITIMSMIITIMMMMIIASWLHRCLWLILVNNTCSNHNHVIDNNNNDDDDNSIMSSQASLHDPDQQ